MKSKKGAKFVLLTSQRSGSAWLTSLLNEFENTIAYSELFLHKKRRPGTRQFWDSNFIYPRFVEIEQKSPHFRPFTIISYLDQLYRKPGAIGFTLMYSQLRSYPEILAYIVRRKIFIVHLIRQNHLDVAISLETLRKSNHAHPTSDQGKPLLAQIHLEPNALNKRMMKLRKNINFIRNILNLFRLHHIEITYENLLHGNSYFGLITDFLSIKTNGSIPSSHLVKIRRGGHKDVIQNYQEVKANLVGTQFEDLIE